MALQWQQIWVIFHRDALNCEGTIVNMTVSSLVEFRFVSRICNLARNNLYYAKRQS